MQRTFISLIIEDDGIGFDASAMRHQAGHFGLSSMEERVKSLGGNIAIISKPGQGTRITIENIQADGGEDPNPLAAASELPHNQEV